MLELDQTRSDYDTIIKVIGVGGCGGNAVNAMINHELEGVEYIVANTDVTDLKKSNAKIKIQLGKKLTAGKGTGAHPERGRDSAIESEEEIKMALQGADMIFIAAGMGGGTGTGAAPVIAQMAREMGILTLAIVTRPFGFEGKQRSRNADGGIKDLSANVDTIIVVPNNRLHEIYQDMAIMEAFNKSDDVLYEGVKAISDIINKSGYMNVDFADVQTVMTNMGYALMGSGVAEGENRAVNAAKEAISNPLLNDVNLEGCKALLINVTAGFDMTMSEFEEVSRVIVNETGEESNTIAGLIMDGDMTGKLRVTIIATGVTNEANIEEKPVIEIKIKDKEEQQRELQSILEKIKSNESRDRVKEELKSKESYINQRYDIPSFMRKVSD